MDVAAGRFRISATRALKNARFLGAEARRALPPDSSVPDIVRGLPTEVLGQLNTVADPASLVTDPQARDFLGSVTFPQVTAAAAEPLFNGRLFFVQVAFTVSGQSSPVVVDTADIQTVIEFSTRAAVPISAYARQYGPNSVAVQANILQFAVSIPNGTYTDNDLQGWVNTIAAQHGLTAADCVAWLNPQAVVNTDADPSQGVGGYHMHANLPYLFVNLAGTGLTIDDRPQFFALDVSHEIAELVVDPRADLVNPEVCDPCGPNCQNVYVDYFDQAGAYINTVQATGFPPSPPSFPYAFSINAIVTPPFATQCPAPAQACAYAPGR